MAVRRPRARLRLGAGATVCVLASATAMTLTTAAGAATPTTKSPSKAAASWLARHLTGTNHDHLMAYGAADPGLTADAVLSMDAAGVAQDAAKRATAWLKTQTAGYVTAGSGHDPGHLAKLLLVAEAQHADLHHFGGVDLVSELRQAEQPSGAYTNTADPSTGDSPVSQALALIALSHTGTTATWPDAAAIAWLVGQECGDGGFYYATQASPPTHCNDVDSTGFAAQALLTVHSSVATSAVGWLRRHRNPDNGYGLQFGSGTPASNANSTAVVVQALRQAGYSAAYGLSWLHKHQIGCSGYASRRGAVKYDDSGFQPDSASYATAQAGQALAKKWLGDISRTGASAAAPRLAC